jgi:cysteinyl-tRNA synthetase
LASIFELTRTANSFMAAHQADVCEMDLDSLATAEQTVVELLGVLGIDIPDEEEAVYPTEVVSLATELGLYHGADPAEAVEALLGERAAARAAKEWHRADAVRDGLAALGIRIEDTPQGARVVVEPKA